MVGIKNHIDCSDINILNKIEKWSFNYFKQKGFEGERCFISSPNAKNINCIKILKPNNMTFKDMDKIVKEFGNHLQNKWTEELKNN